MENAALLHALVHNAIDGIITIDDFGTIESINPSACKLFDYTEVEVIGNNISMLMLSDDQESHNQHLEDYKTTGQAHIIGIGRELTGRKKAGNQFPFKLGVSEVNYAGRRIYAGFIHDLTQQKANEEQLKKYASHLEELVEQRTKILNKTIKDLEKAKAKVSVTLEKEKHLSTLKNRFLSMASHEFRTPLSTAHLSASLIEKYAEPIANANIIRHAGKIINAVNNLTTVLNDFLYIEQLEVGIVPVKLSCFDLVKLAEEITEEMQLLANGEQHIQFTHYGEQRLINLDKNLIKNCVINLITNAIKYSKDHSTIVFTTEITDHHCTISVQDEGIGIPEEDKKYLFQPFFRAQNTGNIPGTGLGLNIVARYITLMEGTISYSSTLNIGTLFTLKFSLK
ncbi:PAS domain-containing sensor histidine kinase [Flavobacterium crassostreae]|uniref:Sensor protein FixL n=1 Tax=Flavobacterium crassostreae TaxID=1763534 RepID=A0A1B9E984_9FLAO|nr:PAS domain-containing sensor histidine kinase [Flavobacterium crassostreae]OCB78530.1 PAS domain-containing sensor histidine kinase [Flavobacterium crassostreae]